MIRLLPHRLLPHRLLPLLVLALAFASPTARADCANPNSATLGSSGTAVGQFTGPQRCAADLAGNLYVVDTGNSRIEKYARSSGTWSAFGSAGTGTGQFTNPRAVAVDSIGNIYVVDSGNSRVQKFNASFTYLASWGSAGTGTGQFNGVQGICVDPTNTYVYTAEYGQGRVQKFTVAGTYVTSWASATASDVACDPSGNVYVSSYGASHVTKYAGTGAVLATIGAPGSGNGQVSGAQGVAVDRYGNLYVADGNNLRIEKFNTAGTWLATVGASLMSNVFGLAVDTTGVLWAPDGTQNHVLKFAAIPVSVVLTGTGSDTYGQTGSWTATVAPTGASGSVSLLDGVTNIGTSALIGAVANFSVAGLVGGTHTLTAQAFSSLGCAGATSAPLSFVVNRAGLSGTLAIAPTTAGIGQPTVWTTTWNNNAAPVGVPTGTIQFQVDGVAAGAPAPLAGGVAVNTFSIATVGVHAISLTYSGDTNFNSGSAAVGNYTIVAPAVMPTFNGAFNAGQLTGLPEVVANGLAFDAADNVYATDTPSNRVLVFSRTGVLLHTWGTHGSGSGAFNGPWGIAVDPAGDVFVSDTGNDLVQKFSASGTFLSQWGSAGTLNGQFQQPQGIATDVLGNVYVADNTNRVQEFTGTGVFVRSFVTGASGSSAPAALAVRPAGNVLATDGPDSRVEEFTNTGGSPFGWGTSGSGNGQFAQPGGLALTPSGNTWVSDPASDRVQEFNALGAWLGMTAVSVGSAPHAVGVDHSGFLYVASSGYAAIYKYALMPSLTSVKDVGNDQGRAVRLHFTPDNSDFATAAFPTTGYEVYRRINAIAGAQRAGSAARAGRANPAGVQVAGWDYVLTVPATGDTAYNVVVPTLADSNAAGLNTSVFFVRGATAQPGVYYDSPADSGWSVDNLPPAVPAPFTAARVSGSTYLHWGANSESDFWYYRLYRGSDPAFTPGPASLVASRSDTGYVDAGASASSTYKLTAVDVNGNESSPAVVSPSGTTAVGGEGPLAFGLERIRPNPTTSRNLTVSFALASDVPARVELLDVAGRVVAARDVVGAGRRTLDLAAGTHVAPGLYLVRLSQGGQHRTERVAVVE